MNGQVIDLEKYPNLFNNAPGQFYIKHWNSPALETDYHSKFIYFMPTNKNIGIALCHHVNDSTTFYPYTTIDGGVTWVAQSVTFRPYSMNSYGTVIQWIPSINQFVIATYGSNFATTIYYYEFDLTNNVLTFKTSINTGNSLTLYTISDVIDDPQRDRFLIIGHSGNSYENAIRIYAVPYSTYISSNTWSLIYTISLTFSGYNYGYVINDKLLVYGYGNNTTNSNNRTYNVWLLSLINTETLAKHNILFSGSIYHPSSYPGFQRPIKFNNKYYLFTTQNNTLFAIVIDPSAPSISYRSFGISGIPNDAKITPQIMIGDYFYILQKNATIYIHYGSIDGTSNKMAISTNTTLSISPANIERYEYDPEHFNNGEAIALLPANTQGNGIYGINMLKNEQNKWVKGV